MSNGLHGQRKAAWIALEGSCRRFYRYDPLKNAWTTLPSPPHSHRNGAGVVVNGKFSVAGGGFSPFTAFDVYDPATNAWRTLTPLPTARQFAVGAPVASKIYVRVWNEGSGAILTLGAGHLFTDSTFCPPCKPNGTIEPTLSYLYTP
jgi:hypothetical protein